jgi:hypothetical protein
MSEYVGERLREDEEFILYRARASAAELQRQKALPGVLRAEGSHERLQQCRI